jgi:twinkle protein|tara:strand:+ start:1940 stop:3574 length:1635 start_codon:yes stop_codon:yes gene_type:complete
MSTTETFAGHYPCHHCSSSDGVALWTNGRGKCFVCNKPAFLDQYDSSVKPKYKTNNYEKDMSTDTIQNIADYDTAGVRERKLTKTVCEIYGMKVERGNSSEITAHYYPYTVNGQVVGYKKRMFPKDFRAVGDLKNPKLELFGQSLFMQGGLRIIITEGELDAIAVQQSIMDKYNKTFPVVSLPSSSNMKILVENREYLRSFKEVVLMFDQDEAGTKAVTAAAKIIGWDIVKVAKLNENDPCETYMKDPSLLQRATFNAQKYAPASIVRGESIWEAYQERKLTKSVPYPKCLEGLNEKLDGMRKGEIVLFTSGTGSGKSTMIKEIVLELQAATEDSIGMVSLEESIGDSAEKFITMFTPENPTLEEERQAFDQVFGNERLVLLDHNGAVSDNSLIDQIENLCLLGCQYIILDHITIAVSEGADGKTGNEAIDAIMSDLLKIVKKHNVWLGLISHLRKAQGGKSFEEGHLSSIDDIKGSGSIKQISFDIITFSRNLVAESEDERNTIHLRVLKSRFTGRTGDCGSAFYNTRTNRLRGQEDFLSYTG